MTPSLPFGVVCGLETVPSVRFATQDEAQRHAEQCELDDFPRSYYVVRWEEWRWLHCMRKAAT